MRLTTRVRRRLPALVLVALLAAAACGDGGPSEETGAPVTEPPTASPGVQSSGDFQISGNVDHAFQGIGPPIQVSLAGVSLSPSPEITESPGASPTATIETETGAPTQQGVLRITLDNVSSTLAERCGANAGDKVNVFWLTDTQFDTSLLTGTTLEGSLEGRSIGIAGEIFVTDGNQQQDFALPSPTTTPQATVGALNTNCTLVADRITSGTATLPTVRPRTRARTQATVRPTVRPTPTPRRTTRPTSTAPTATAPTATAPTATAPTSSP